MQELRDRRIRNSINGLTKSPQTNSIAVSPGVPQKVNIEIRKSQMREKGRLLSSTIHLDS